MIISISLSCFIFNDVSLVGHKVLENYFLSIIIIFKFKLNDNIWFYIVNISFENIITFSIETKT